jgi:hypothetical protein
VCRARPRLASLDLGTELDWAWVVYRLHQGGAVRYGMGVCPKGRKIRWGRGMESGEIYLRAGVLYAVAFCMSHWV